MRILVCPLDWGLGHATRCIPLIRALIDNGHQVRIGASGGGLVLLRGEFPELEIFPFPGYQVRYSRRPAFFLPVLLWQLPRLLLGMLAEARRLRSILAEHPADLVLSDGRYGVFSRGRPSIFITHQVFLRLPGHYPGSALAERLILTLNLSLLRRFTRVWVPDFPGPDSLSGELSHGPSALRNLEFIHPLSRFSQGAGEGKSRDKEPHRFPPVDILAVVSGPEPQRGLFEAVLRKQLGGREGTRVLVRGLPGQTGSAGSASRLPAIHPGALNEFDHLSGSDLCHLFGSAALIVVRSGYTTVMELAGLGARAVVLVPTPGQSEQEYLADHLQKTGAGIRMDQDVLDLGAARERLQAATGFSRWAREEAVRDANAFSLSGFLANHPVLTAWKD